MLKIVKSSLIIFSVTSLILACASVGNPTYGPIKEDSFQDTYLSGVTENQQVIFYSRAIWYANKNGFKFFPAGKKSRKGVIAYTDQGIYFLEWSAKKYNAVFTASFEEIKEARLAANDLFGRIVVKKDKYNSFEILGVNGPELPDKDETEVAYQIIVKQQEK